MYKLIEAESPEKLNSKINKLLAEGWKLYGHPGHSVSGPRIGSEPGKNIYVDVFYQAMVKD